MMWSAKCWLQFSQQQIRPDHLCLWLAAQIGFAVRDVLSGGGYADRAGSGVPDRGDGRVLHPVEPLAVRLTVAGQF
jgi:hypothetical protein